jgi:phosphoribosylformylglycinamidine synthase
MTALMPDVRRAVTSDFKAPGDVVYLLGDTYDELGGSELYHLFGELGQNVPRVRPAEAKDLYEKVGRAHDANFIVSCHDLSDGGLAVAVAESLFGDDSLGAELTLEGELPALTELFSESHSRFVVTVAPEDVVAFEALMEGRATRLGVVTDKGRLVIRHLEKTVVDAATADLREAWSNGPVNRVMAGEELTLQAQEEWRR